MLVSKEPDGMIKISNIHPSEAHIMAYAYELLEAVNYHLKKNNEESLAILNSTAIKSNAYEKLMGEPTVSNTSRIRLLSYNKINKHEYEITFFEHGLSINKLCGNGNEKDTEIEIQWRELYPLLKEWIDQ